MTCNILVVDDEPDIRGYLRSLLEDQGYGVREAENGIVGMEQVRKEKPDLVLLDLQMPEETGTGFYRKLHNSKEFGALPVIIISGHAGRNLAVSKSVIVFDKPIDEEGLLDAIRKILV